MATIFSYHNSVEVPCKQVHGNLLSFSAESKEKAERLGSNRLNCDRRTYETLQNFRIQWTDRFERRFRQFGLSRLGSNRHFLHHIEALTTHEFYKTNSIRVLSSFSAKPCAESFSKQLLQSACETINNIMQCTEKKKNNKHEKRHHNSYDDPSFLLFAQTEPIASRRNLDRSPNSSSYRIGLEQVIDELFSTKSF